MNKPDKGKKFGSCNRKACQKPSAVFYNKSTQKYYCSSCADKINKACGETLCKRFDMMESKQ